MRLLHITTVVVSALILFGCSDDSAKGTQEPEPQETPNSCDEECSGDPICLNDTRLKTCVLNKETGCMKWVESDCPEKTSCQEGACEPQTDVADCPKECTEEAECLNETTLKTCVLNKETGCAEWIESTCLEGESCLNGACQTQTEPPECQKECTESTKCLSETTQGTCQLNEETGCVEWIESLCPEDTSCSEGECKSATVCETSCPKQGICTNESTLKSCQFNEAGCAEWVESTCPEGTSCTDGMCLSEPKPPVCTDTCSAPKCADEHAYQKCEDTNSDGCMELSAPVSCADKQICKDGACIPDDNIYLKDLKPIMQPFWNNKQMLEETAMFINVGDTAQMLYNVDNVEKLTSYDGSKIYTGGVDYTVVGGKLQTLNTAIPHITDAKYYNVAETMLVTEHNGNHVYTYWGEGTTMTQWQVKVTYNHSDAWNGFKQPSYNATFARFIQKLKNKENVKILFYGDSITFGANASYVVGGGSQHSYSMLFTEALADLYGYKVEYQASGLPNTFTNMPPTYNPTNGPTITYMNNAVGGWRMVDGQNSFETYITPYAKDVDLFILAFGMNDGSTDLTALNQMAVNMMTRIQQVSPNISEVVMSTMLPNPKALNGWYANQVYQEETFANGVIKTMQAQGIPIALCQMTSMSSSILTRKEFKDYTGNNINHPNDFFSRVYAQTLLQTVIGYENMK